MVNTTDTQADSAAVTPTRKCRTCLQDKPITEFYICGSQLQRRCKQCMTMDRRSRTLYSSNMGKMFREWPQELQEYAQLYSEYEEQGGKVNYSQSVAPELVVSYRLAAAEGETPLDLQDGKLPGTTKPLIDIEPLTIEGITEGLCVPPGSAPLTATVYEMTMIKYTEKIVKAFNILSDAYQKLYNKAWILQNQLISIQSQLISEGIGSDAATPTGGLLFAPDDRDPKKLNEALSKMPEFSAQECQERSNLLKRIKSDTALREIFGDDEFSTFVDDLSTMSKTMGSLGYVDPYLLRRVVVVFEDYQVPMPDDVLVFYKKFILPGLTATQCRGDYEQLSEVVTSLVGLNFYEEPWENIPHTE